MGVDPRPAILAICFPARTSFATAIGCPTNLIVFGPAGCELAGFAKVGAIMNVLSWILAILFIPLLCPF